MTAAIIMKAPMTVEQMTAPELVPAAYLGMGLLALAVIFFAIDLYKNGWRSWSL